MGGTSAHTDHPFFQRCRHGSKLLFAAGCRAAHAAEFRGRKSTDSRIFAPARRAPPPSSSRAVSGFFLYSIIVDANFFETRWRSRDSDCVYLLISRQSVGFFVQNVTFTVLMPLSAV